MASRILTSLRGALNCIVSMFTTRKPPRRRTYKRINLEKLVRKYNKNSTHHSVYNRILRNRLSEKLHNNKTNTKRHTTRHIEQEKITPTLDIKQEEKIIPTGDIKQEETAASSRHNQTTAQIKLEKTTPPIKYKKNAIKMKNKKSSKKRPHLREAEDIKPSPHQYYSSEVQVRLENIRNSLELLQNMNSMREEENMIGEEDARGEYDISKVIHEEVEVKMMPCFEIEAVQAARYAPSAPVWTPPTSPHYDSPELEWTPRDSLYSHWIERRLMPPPPLPFLQASIVTPRPQSTSFSPVSSQRSHRPSPSHFPSLGRSPSSSPYASTPHSLRRNFANNYIPQVKSNIPYIRPPPYSPDLPYSPHSPYSRPAPYSPTAYME